MRYRVPPRLAHVVAEQSAGGLPVVYLRQLPDGEPLVLTGAGGIIWAIAAEGGDDVVTAVAAVFDCPVNTVAEDVSSFLNELVSRGLLEQETVPSEQECDD